MTHVTVYMRLYYPGSNYKITWKCMFEKNKTLFQYEGRWIGTTHTNRLSCPCSTFSEKKFDQSHNLQINNV